MKNINKHILFWICYAVYFCSLDWLNFENFNLLDELAYILIHIWIFYSAYWFLKNFSYSTGLATLRSVSRLLLSLGVFALLGYLYYYHFHPYVNPKQVRNLDYRFRIIDGLIWYNQFFFYALGYYYAQRFIRRERDLRLAEEEKKKLLEEKLALEQANHKMEKEKILTEFAYLRAQINPHFLHNTLNFFYAKSLHCSQELSEGILTLSNVMRYSLQNEEDGNGLVLLSKETEHLQNLIRINQLRYNNKLQIVFTVNGDATDVRIIPLVLITLVENSFKHGELSDSRHPLAIRLNIDQEKKLIAFHVHNKKKKGPKELSNGIGLDNTRRRLEWVYKDNYRFHIRDEEDFYTTELILPVLTASGDTAGSGNDQKIIYYA